VTPWYINRVRPAQLAGSLGLLAGSLGKPARDVTLSPHLREGVPARGGSSAMVHKRSPVAAVVMRAAAGDDPDLGAAGELVDRAVAAHGR
jgi:3-carboxy-cis,cis-muconate cycloisomerase